MPSPSRRLSIVLIVSSNMNIAVFSPRSAAAVANWAARVDLPVPAAPTTSVLVPRSMPPPSSVSSSVIAAREAVDWRRRIVGFARDEPREDLEASFANDVIVEPAAEVDASILEHDASAAARPPYSGLSCSSRTTPCAMLCTCRS